MRSFYFQKTTELKRTKSQLEKKLNVKISITGRKVSMHGKTLDEYEASIILDAINFGFSTKNALLIKEQGMIFRIIQIRQFTRKKNLKDVRARIIGKRGQTKSTIEHISSCHIVINDSEIGMIGDPESIEELVTAVTNLIRGSKQSNTYRYLEKTQSRHKKEPYDS